MKITGFGSGEIDLLLDATSQSDRSDDVPPVQSESFTKVGDLWILGNHRLLCADARNQESFVDLMSGDRARVGFSDPPYNVPIAGHVGGLGSIKPREFAMGCGEMSKVEFTQFLRTSFANIAGVSLDGAINSSQWIGGTFMRRLLQDRFAFSVLGKQTSRVIGASRTYDSTRTSRAASGIRPKPAAAPIKYSFEPIRYRPLARGEYETAEVYIRSAARRTSEGK